MITGKYRILSTQNHFFIKEQMSFLFFKWWQSPCDYCYGYKTQKEAEDELDKYIKGLDRIVVKEFDTTRFNQYQIT